MKSFSALLLCIFALNLSAQTILTAPGLASFKKKAASGGGGGSACSTVVTALGPVRYWNFDDGGTSTTADSSGNGATLSLIGSPASIAGKAGAHALTFAANTKYGTNRNPVAITSFTLAAWINPSSLAADHNMIISAMGFNMWLEVDASGHPSFHSYANVDFPDTTTTITTGTWWHIAATISGADGTTGTVKLYVNGAVKINTTGVVALKTDSFAIATYGAGVGALGFTGSIDEPVIFNRALSDSEISSIATCN